MFNFFIERVRSNLHIILCMSPVGDPFRNRIRMYPAFVNCTTIDWFSEWPQDALLEVAEKYLESMELGDDDTKGNVAKIFVTVHRSVVDTSKRMLLEVKRHNYVTSTNYLELVSGYKYIIHGTLLAVESMSIELEDAKTKVADFQKQCEELP
ncbi:dynein axonemal heavy chain 2-like [Montipora foliosa]|uniref:dynein axonemal heavy chain 2-like n=1 Tax=Montipora foliosa TaxID=591990 RepID=UPI0035F17FED